MKKRVLAVIAASLATLSTVAMADSPDDSHLSACFATAALGVNMRAESEVGKTLEEQLEKARKDFGEDSTAYTLHVALGKLVYSNELPSRAELAALIHMRCLKLNDEVAARYERRTGAVCPGVGVMVIDLVNMRRREMDKDLIANLLARRYLSLPLMYRGGIANVPQPDDATPVYETGRAAYLECMHNNAAEVDKP